MAIVLKQAAQDAVLGMANDLLQLQAQRALRPGIQIPPDDQAVLDFIADSPLVAHNAAFDFGFLNAELTRVGRAAVAAYVDGEHGRLIFAVPGRIDQNTSAGCHQLIRDGATLMASLTPMTARSQ